MAGSSYANYLGILLRSSARQIVKFGGYMYKLRRKQLVTPFHVDTVLCAYWQYHHFQQLYSFIIIRLLSTAATKHLHINTVLNIEN